MPELERSVTLARLRVRDDDSLPAPRLQPGKPPRPHGSSLPTLPIQLADPYLNNGVALAANTKNAARTLQVLDRIIEDKSFTNKDQFPPYATWTPAYVQHKKDIVAKGFLVQTTT